MKNDNVHPARSADFLSRLHDGELTAAERARFDSHRAHCPDCRRAALDFENALSLFRASSTSPPPPDLSARILRRLQSASPRRRPFGVVFGINPRWAAAFAVAILATIAGSLLVIERESLRKAPAAQTPIPVLLQSKERPAERGDAPPPAAAAPRQRAAENKAPARKPLSENTAAAPQRQAFAPEPSTAHEEKVQGPARREAGLTEPRAAKTMESAAPLLRAESAGGEGSPAPAAASPEPGPRAHPILIALDGQGGAPEIVTPAAAELLADLRGREFVLLVEPSGRVREARLDGRKSPQALSRSKDAVEEAIPQTVRDLRFRPTDRPRRLLLRIE